MIEVYVAVLEDRHIDDVICPCRTMGSAENVLDEWARQYDGRYVFEEEIIDGWERYYISDIEDGPEMRIEKLELID